MIPLLDLKPQFQQLKGEIMPMLEELCASQMFILGQKVTDFEEAAAKYSGAVAACAVSSGSDALLIALMAENIGPGDEVITTPYTFFATAGAIARVGARIVFADIDPENFNLDPAHVEALVTPRTRAILPVHLYGRLADMAAFEAIAKKHNLVLVEDACQAIGAEDAQGRRAGSIGDYGCFSFFPSKNLGCFGDGGLVTATDPARAHRVEIMRNHGMEPQYYHHCIGGNFRLDALQAAVVTIKLRRLDSWTARRQANAALYRKLFAEAGLGAAGSPVLLPPEVASRHIYNQFVIRAERRDALMQRLLDNDIGCAIYYPVPLHLQECFASLGGKPGDCPQSEKAANETLALPIYPDLTPDMLAFVVSTIASFYK